MFLNLVLDDAMEDVGGGEKVKVGTTVSDRRRPLRGSGSIESSGSSRAYRRSWYTNGNRRSERPSPRSPRSLHKTKHQPN